MGKDTKEATTEEETIYTNLDYDATVAPPPPPTTVQSFKRVAKNNGELGGAALAIISSKIFQAYGIPVGETEAIILGGFFVGVGASIRNLLWSD